MIVHVVALEGRGGGRRRRGWRAGRRPAEPEVIKKGKTDKDEDEKEQEGQK